MVRKKTEGAEATEVKKTTRKASAEKKTTARKSSARGRGRTSRKKEETPAEPVENVEITTQETVAETNEKMPQNNETAIPVADETPRQEVAVEAETPQNETQQAAETEPETVQEEMQPEQKTDEPAPQAETEEPVKAEPQEQRPLPPVPTMRIDSIVDLINAPHRQLLLNDQQIQQLTVSEAVLRFRWIEGTLAWILNYDVVISDTNIWLELLVGHTSSHSNPKVNARLMFERQLEFISKLTRHRHARFMMMSETYEEIDRFASQQAPTNYKDADFKDEAVCRNAAARLAKNLILCQQRENRLKIEAIGAESHHASFADPAIIRKTVELFAQGKKVLLLTNDASVAIRSMGMCDDLQRTNNIDDDTWEEVYTPLRPMVMTMEDLKLLDNYTRQYHFLQMAAGKQWMEDVPTKMEKRTTTPLKLWMEGFRSGDKHPENRAEREKERQKQKQVKQQPQPQQSEKAPQQPVQPQPQKQEKPQQQVEQPKPEQQQMPKAQKPKQGKKELRGAKTQAEQPKTEVQTPEVEPEQQSAVEAPAPQPEIQQQPAEAQEAQPKKRRPYKRRPAKKQNPQQ